MTVRELIKTLRLFDQSASVVVDDADTGWYLDLQEVTGEMNSQKNYSIVILKAYYSSKFLKD